MLFGDEVSTGSGSDRVQAQFGTERSFVTAPLLARANPVATAPGTDSMTCVAT